MGAGRLTRDELYQLVWSQPMRTLAAQFGMSDRGVAKACERHRIPVPGRGYWAKKAAGKSVRRTPLPTLPPNSGDDLREVWFEAQPPHEKRLPAGPAAEQEAFERAPENLIVVSDSLRSAHPLVRRAAETIKGGDWRDPHLDIDVSRDCLNRALRIMDALVKAFETRGWSISLGSGDDRKSYVIVLGQHVPFGVREKLKHIKNDPAKPVRLPSGQTYTPYQSPYQEVRSGQLALVIRQSWGYGVHKSWNDTASWRVEDRLNAFVVGIVAYAADELERHRRYEENERVRLEAERRRLEEARRREEEAARGRELERQAESWSKSQRIVAYLAAVREAAMQKGIPVEPGSPLEKWLQWASAYARLLNPIAETLSIRSESHFAADGGSERRT
jgi:hypothetical protein